MVFVPAVNCAEVAMLYHQLGEPVENVYHVQNTSAWTPTSLNALVANFLNWETVTAAPGRNNQTELVKIVASDLTTQTGIQVATDITPPVVGAGTGQAPPNNVTIAVSWRTGVRGRSFRGRTFHIGLEEDQFSGNGLVTAALTHLLTMYETLLTDVNALTGETLVVLSRRHNNAWRAAGVTTPITFASIDPIMDSQRRRLPGHNRHH